jgi:uncharacterized protein (DUF488 family)
MKRSVLTIGYEGAEIDAFLATLSLAGVQHLVDVRDIPISRKRGFSKSKLADALSTIGIRYTHLKALGDPKEGREAMKRGDYRGFLNIYNQHIAAEEAQQALHFAAEIARQENVALLCYERNPKECHRTIVADQLLLRGVSDIRHLGVNISRKSSTQSVQSGAKSSFTYMLP